MSIPDRAAGAARGPGRRLAAAGQRLLTAAVGIPILFVVVKKGPAWAVFALVSLCAALAAREACLLLATPARRPLTWLAMTGSVLVGVPFLAAGAAGATPGGPAGAFLLPFVITLLTGGVLLTAVLTSNGLTEAVETTLATLFPVIFVGLPLGFLTGLRGVEDVEMGRDLLVLLLVVIWFGDTAAMYVGSLIGRHRLAPRISPRKSVEGALAAAAGGIGGALLAHVWWFHRLDAVHAVVIGTILSVVGILGDLAESVIKRAAGAKDSSTILPGHGGILDRIDSLLFAGPALYYYYLAVLR